MAKLNHNLQEKLLQIIKKPQDEVRLMLEMLVRAYDPCISCSVHFLTVEFS